MNRRSFLLTAIGSFFAGLWPWPRKKPQFIVGFDPAFPNSDIHVAFRQNPTTGEFEMV